MNGEYFTIDIEEPKTASKKHVFNNSGCENISLVEEQRLARSILKIRTFLGRTIIQNHPQNLIKLLSIKYFKDEPFNIEVKQHLKSRRKYVQFVMNNNSNIIVHAFFGFSGNQIADTKTLRTSVFCFVETKSESCRFIKFSTFFDLTGSITKTQFFADEIDGNTETELDLSWGTDERKAIFRAMLVRCGLLKHESDQTCLLSTSGSVSLKTHVQIQIKHLEIVGAVAYGSNILRKGLRQLYYKRKLHEHHFDENEGSKKFYVKEEERLALPFCNPDDQIGLPVDESDWDHIKVFHSGKETNSETLELKYKKSYVFLDPNSLLHPLFRTQVTHLYKRKSGFSKSQLDFLFCENETIDPVILLSRTDNKSYVFMEKGKLDSMTRSSRFNLDRSIDVNTKHVKLKFREVWCYRAVMIFACALIVVFGLLAILRGKEPFENILLAAIGTFSVIYLAVENVGIYLSCFPLREILKGSVQLLTWEQVRALQNNNSLRAKIWLYAECRDWCPAEDFGASFIKGEKSGVFRHPGMSFRELQKVGIFLVKCSETKKMLLIDFINHEELFYTKYGGQARIVARKPLSNSSKFRKFFIKDSLMSTQFM